MTRTDDRIREILADYLHASVAEEYVERFADPEIDGVYAVKLSIPTSPHESETLYLLVDVNGDWTDVEEVEFDSWPPTPARSLDVFNVGSGGRRRRDLEAERDSLRSAIRDGGHPEDVESWRHELDLVERRLRRKGGA